MTHRSVGTEFITRDEDGWIGEDLQQRRRLDLDQAVDIALLDIERVEW